MSKDIKSMDDVMFDALNETLDKSKYTDTMKCESCKKDIYMGMYQDWSKIAGEMMVLCPACADDHWLSCKPYEEEEYYQCGSGEFREAQRKINLRRSEMMKERVSE